VPALYLCYVPNQRLASGYNGLTKAFQFTRSEKFG
jgi:hypothetical protein